TDLGTGGGGATAVTVIGALFAVTVNPLFRKNRTSYCPAGAGTTRWTVPATKPGAGGTEPLASSVESHFHDAGSPGPLADPTAYTPSQSPGFPGPLATVAVIAADAGTVTALLEPLT